MPENSGRERKRGFSKTLHPECRASASWNRGTIGDFFPTTFLCVERRPIAEAARSMDGGGGWLIFQESHGFLASRRYFVLVTRANRGTASPDATQETMQKRGEV